MRENDLLAHIQQITKALDGRVQVGPGDDLAVVQLGQEQLLVGTDQLIDGIHVDLNTVGPEAASRKAVMRAFSDVAAMAAKPLGCLISAVLPKQMSQADAEAMVLASQEAAHACGGSVLGGDTAVGEGPMVLTVTVLAEAAAQPPVLRSGAKPGDALYVTGQLGGAWQSGPEAWHLNFKPRIQEARWLGEHVGLTAMMDLSDGLSMDLSRMIQASGVDARVESDGLPIRPGATLNQAYHDGEDYELCFAVSEDRIGLVPDDVLGTPITRIGQMTECEPGATPTCWHVAGDKAERLVPEGWEHGDG